MITHGRTDQINQLERRFSVEEGDSTFLHPTSSLLAKSDRVCLLTLIKWVKMAPHQSLHHQSVSPDTLTMSREYLPRLSKKGDNHHIL